MDGLVGVQRPSEPLLIVPRQGPPGRKFRLLEKVIQSPAPEAKIVMYTSKGSPIYDQQVSTVDWVA